MLIYQSQANNLFFENNEGISYSANRNGSIYSNNFSSNVGNGIHVSGSSYSNSYANEIMNNTVQKNGNYGIKLKDCEGYNIIWNNINLNEIGGVYIGTSQNVTCSKNTIKNNRHGINLSYSSFITLNNNSIAQNLIGISVLYDSKDEVYGIVIVNNSIYNNSKFGMSVDAWQGDLIIIAENNWWGSESGPYHEENNSYGMGDNVTDLIDFHPWIGLNEKKLKEYKNDEYDMIFLMGMGSISLITIVGLIRKVENLKIIVYSIIIIPLYSKIKRNEIFTISNRTDVYEKIYQNPGIHYSKILKEIRQKNGTLIYHLRVLENEGIIRSEKKFGKRYYFPKGTTFRSQDIHLPPTQRSIVNHLNIHGRKTPMDLQSELSLPSSTVGYNLKVLLQKEILVVERKNKNSFYSLYQR